MTHGHGAAVSSGLPALPRRFVGMRWWLGLAFAGVAAVTAMAVVAVLNVHADAAFRNNAEAFAVGDTTLAANMLRRDVDRPSRIRADTPLIAARRHLRLYVFDYRGRPLSATASKTIPWSQVPAGGAALTNALAHKRYVHGSQRGTSFVVGIAIAHNATAPVLVSYSRRPELRAQLGLVHHEFWVASLVALAVGGALGLLIAVLISRRLARIARAAKAIGDGDLRGEIEDRFPDEVGSLAHSINEMKSRLDGLFRTLESERNRLEGLLERLHDGVLLVAPDLTVEFANKRARDLLSFTNRLDLCLLPAADVAAVCRFAADLFTAAPPATLRIADDDHVLVLAGLPPAEPGGGAIIVVADTSERERHERAQREFAANAAHEFRSPLAAIITAVEMLQTGAKDDDPAVRDEFLAVIERESGRLSRLIRALLVLARAQAREESPRRATIAVADVLEQVAASFAPRDGLELTVDCPQELTVEGDSDLLEQALLSITANAVKYTAAGTVTLRGRDEGGRVVIEVSDTGTGIALRERQRVFERFYGSGDGSGGFGLGLSIARAAVEALGGEINLQSEPAVGTTIRITLTAARARALV